MEKLLIIGCGDVARRALPQLTQRYRVAALSRDPQALPPGVEPVSADLDTLETPAWRGFPADCILHSAPPGEGGATDMRTRRLIAGLSAAGALPQRLVYISTSGVYGDCGGEWVDESRPVNPMSDRARRRVDAEAALLAWGAAEGVKVSVLRAPGIYAADRLPVERLRRGTPALRDEDDVFTNHIHADDLAAICVAALERASPGGLYNASDDSALKMAAWFDLVAERAGLAPPPRVSRAEAQQQINPALLSFMGESRRLSNARMKKELAVVLRYPTVFDGVPDMRASVQNGTKP
jgi:nucleoside-diphosphate-sugar epimerase